MTDPQDDDSSLERLVGRSMEDIDDERRQEAESERRAAERRARRAARRRAAVFVLVPLCAVLTGLNLVGWGWFGEPSPPPLDPAAARAAAERLLEDAIDELDQYHARHGRYPETPAFMGPGGDDGVDEPFAYRVIRGDRYELSVTIAGETVRHDSRATALTTFRGSAP